LVPDLGDFDEFRPDALIRFYERPEWRRALREFANVDEDESEVALRVRTAMLALARSRSGVASPPSIEQVAH
jgi:hypothetical protein